MEEMKGMLQQQIIPLAELYAKILKSPPKPSLKRKAEAELRATKNGIGESVSAAKWATQDVRREQLRELATTIEKKAAEKEQAKLERELLQNEKRILKEAENVQKETVRSLLVHHKIVGKEEVVRRWLPCLQKFYRNNKDAILAIIGHPPPKKLAEYVAKFAAHNEELMNI
jgi:hypothetical protein